jgi:hypothetical protein
MKKFLIAILILLGLATTCIYIFIPRVIRVSHVETMHVNGHWAFAYLSNTMQWKKWWPKEENTVAMDSGFTYKSQHYVLDSLFYNAMTINIIHGGNSNHSKLRVLPLKRDEVQVGWECQVDGSMNPLTRLKQYQNAVMIKQGMEGLLVAYKNWVGVTENIYGFNVIAGKIADTLLIAKRAKFSGSKPTPLQVDSLLNILRTHFGKFGAKQNGLSMLHFVSNEPGVFEAQVAIPIDRVVPETAEIKIKRMFAGNALITRVKGGPYTIEKAYEACENYSQDHLRTAPAIPFQSMVTDRAKVSDTSKWETILYFPVR